MSLRCPGFSTLWWPGYCNLYFFFLFFFFCASQRCVDFFIVIIYGPVLWFTFAEHLVQNMIRLPADCQIKYVDAFLSVIANEQSISDLDMVQWSPHDADKWRTDIWLCGSWKCYKNPVSQKTLIKSERVESELSTTWFHFRPDRPIMAFNLLLNSQKEFFKNVYRWKYLATRL